VGKEKYKPKVNICTAIGSIHYTNLYFQWCAGGSCKAKTEFVKPTVSPTIGWGTWTSDVCKSGCIAKSKGFRTKKRKCKNAFNKGCDGASFEVTLCNDEQVKLNVDYM
jgi:hypothetical protein